MKRRASEPDRAESIRGTVERIIYANEENHYTVAVLTPDDRSGSKDEVTVVGTFPGLVEGESVLCEGRWEDHKKFGRQFAVETFSSTTPPTLLGLERYLASDLIDGIGPEFAHRIVETFGENTLEIIEEEPRRLLEVPGIGRGRLEKITTSWGRHRAVRDVLVFLQGLGISAAYASRIYRRFGAGAIDLIKENPYRLVEVRGIGFRTADKIAGNLGFERDSMERVRAGVLYALDELAGSGHTCFPRDRLVPRAAELLGVDAEQVERAIADEERDGRIVVERELPDEPVYRRALHEAEFVVAELLRHIASAESQLAGIDAPAAVAWAEKRNRIELDPTQREAVQAALTHKVTVITGGPGVGKTTIVNCIIPILRAKGLRVRLAAPTGRAAKRAEETTGHKAETIHRMLKWNPRSGEFQMNQDNPLEADAVIIDETSMIDITLMRHLLLAVPWTAVLILVGDVDQLPSVGPGNVLRDIIRSGQFPVKRLEQIFRQAERSPIIWNAHRINQGRMPDLQPQPRADREGFYFIERDEPQAVLDTILELCTDRIPNRFELDPADDIQVMAPMYRGLIGVTNLNAELRRTLNPDAHPEIKRFGRAFAPRDKVMQIRNDYDKDVFNGDIGRVADVDRIAERITVRFEDKAVDYGLDELDNLQTAYAISVHKSQGSEYPAVVITLSSHHYVMLQRNLLYTAVTRGVRLVVIVGDRKALARAVRNDRIRRRYTTLAERLSPR
ncbi:MAG: ATP-dependent RecD-like DNA helicase [Planctomycetota bacterium]